jgi:hypothetical protein
MAKRYTQYMETFYGAIKKGGKEKKKRKKILRKRKQTTKSFPIALQQPWGKMPGRMS